MKISLCFWTALALLVFGTDFVRADYEVEVRLQSYSNPTNQAAARTGDCCDPGPEDRFNCTGDQRCDNYFVICLRPLGTLAVTRTCTIPGASITTDVVPDGEFDFINFTQPALSLGISNPFNLSVSGPWQGVQLFVRVNDRDDATISDDSIADDFIDAFAIELSSSLSVGSRVPLSNTEGALGYAMISLTARVLCAQFYHGDQCQFIDRCTQDNITCNGRGTCIPMMNTSYTCACDPGFTGMNCEQSQFCFEQNCSMRGVCGNGVCDCEPGYTGVVCEIEINECEGQDCSGNGRCIDGIGLYSCACIPGYTGMNCETNINDCEDQNCSGNGECVDDINSYRCDCHTGFTGINCETSNYCAGVDCSGNGQCFNRESNFTCICRHGYTGELCNVKVQVEAVSGGVIGGMTGALLVLVLIIILLLVAIALLVRKRKALMSTSTASDRSRKNHSYETVPDPENSQGLQANASNEQNGSLGSETVAFENEMYDTLPPKPVSETATAT